jgi:GMP synthase-like glutamine amidotransferase
MKILAIQNCAVEGFGRYERRLVARGVDYTLVHPYRGQRLPPAEAFDLLLVGGTPISAYAAKEYPFLLAEHRALQGAVAAGKTCLGICCGAQLLAQTLGAEVRRCERMEIGGYQVRLTGAGGEDALLRGFPARFPVFHWHGDTFSLPAGADLLVEGDDCRNQMFRWGSVFGVQFHLEVTADDAALWADAYPDELAEFGKSKAQVVAECRAREDEMMQLADRLIDNLLEIARGPACPNSSSGRSSAP